MKHCQTFCAFIIAIVLIGCSGSGITQKTIVEDRTITAAVPIIQNTLPAIQRDTFIVSQKIVERDTVIDIRYYPKTQTMFIKIKPDSIHIVIHDTVQVFTGYNDADLDSVRLSGGRWGAGIAIVTCAGIYFGLRKLT